MFYELLAGMNDWDKQELYLQAAETYYYLNQVRVTLLETEYLFSLCSFPSFNFVLCLSQGWLL